MQCISAFEVSFRWYGFDKTYGGYDEMIWLVSLSILCDIDNGNFKRITDILKRDKVNDHLLSFIIKSKLFSNHICHSAIHTFYVPLFFTFKIIF
jgi:hypothetical protein